MIMVGNVHIMGIVNLTPDSFYAGSRVKADEAVSRIRQMLAEGADVIDLGACSTRPGSLQPSLEEEWKRLEPVLLEMAGYSPQGDSAQCARVIGAIRRPAVPGILPSGKIVEGEKAAGVIRGQSPRKLSGGGQASGGAFLPISIDTYRSEIVRRAYELIGPFIVNDISGGQMDPAMLETVGRLGLPYIAMHMRGTPETMQSLTDYDDVVTAVIDYFREFSLKAEEAGIADWIPDPGFGFSKTLEQNYELLNRLEEVVSAFPDREMLVGLSRKSMVYKALGITPEEAMPATQIVQYKALEKGARWLRVHDVAEAVETARLYSTMNTSSPGAAK